MSKIKEVRLSLELLQWAMLYKAKTSLKVSAKLSNSLTLSLSRIQAGLIKYESPVERDRQISEIREVLHDNCVKVGELLAIIHELEDQLLTHEQLIPSEN